MTGNYTIKSGDTLFNIAKKQYHLTDKNEILAKARELAKANGIKNYNTIFTGKNLDFNKANTTTENTTTADASVFDGSNPSYQNFTDWEKASNKSENGTGNDFVFAKGYEEDYKQTGKGDSGIYQKEILSFAKNLIKGKDENGDGSIQYEEFQNKNKNVADERIKVAFDAEDLNHDGKIDETEQASVIAGMDSDAKNQINGKISSKNFKEISKDIGDKDKTKELQTKLQQMHDFLFKADEAKTPAQTEKTEKTEDYYTKIYNEEFQKAMGGYSGNAGISGTAGKWMNVGNITSMLSTLFTGLFTFKMLKF